MIIFGTLLNTLAMDPPQKEKPVQAYIGFTYETVIRSKIAPNRAYLEFESKEDAQRKRTLFDRFRTEMIAENNLFDSACKHFQRIVLLMPSTKDPVIYLPEIIDKEITETHQRIHSLRQAIMHRYRISSIRSEKVRTLALRKQHLMDLQIEFRTIQEWEMVRRIFDQVECKEALEEIVALQRQSTPKSQEVEAQSLPLPIINNTFRRQEKEKFRTSSTTHKEGKSEGMANFLSWLDLEVLPQKKLHASPTPDPSPFIKTPKTTENFI